MFSKIIIVFSLYIISSFAGSILTMICVSCKENLEQEISDKEQESWIRQYNHTHNPK